jgi:hypothetical protein
MIVLAVIALAGLVAVALLPATQVAAAALQAPDRDTARHSE